MNQLDFINLLDAQPVGTYLIFEGGYYPMALKLRDGRWGIAVEYNTDKTVNRVPLHADGPAIWMSERKTGHWLY